MMKFVLEIELANSAFEDRDIEELADILEDLSKRVRTGPGLPWDKKDLLRLGDFTLRDSHSNTVGKARYTDRKR